MNLRALMFRWRPVTVAVPILALYSIASAVASAATIDFTGISLPQVSSVIGQDFLYIVGSGPDTGTLNVRLLGGTPDALIAGGGGPDPSGFFVLESTFVPIHFQFTFDTARSFIVAQNETVIAAENNAFISQGSSWSVLSSSNVTIAGSGTTIGFTGQNNSPPYGDYMIAAIGPSFDFMVTDTPPPFGQFGSAISINVIPEPSTFALAGVALVALGAYRLRRPRR